MKRKGAERKEQPDGKVASREEENVPQRLHTNFQPFSLCVSLVDLVSRRRDKNLHEEAGRSEHRGSNGVNGKVDEQVRPRCRRAVASKDGASAVKGIEPVSIAEDGYKEARHEKDCQNRRQYGERSTRLPPPRKRCGRVFLRLLLFACAG